MEGTHEAIQTDRIGFFQRGVNVSYPRDSLVVVSVRRARSRNEQKRVEERFEARLCLMKKESGDDLIDCENSTFDPIKKKPVASRCVCSACYQAFGDLLKTLPPEEAVRVEQEAIARGWILDLQETRNLNSKYAFKRLVG